MKSSMRLVWWVLISAPLLLLVVAAAALFTLDPNRLRPVLENAAARYEVALRLEGDLSWQLYPRLGIAIGQVSAKNSAGQPLVEVGSASVVLKLWPLLQRKLEIDGIRLADTTVYYEVAHSGASNWGALAQAAASEAAPPAQTNQPAATQPPVTIASVHVTRLNLHYHNAANGQLASITEVTLSLHRFNLAGAPFGLTADLVAKLDGWPEVAVAFSSTAELDPVSKTLALPKARLLLSNGIQQTTINFTNQTQWSETLTSLGTLDVQPSSLRGWLGAAGITLPPMQNVYALGRVGLQTDYRYTPEVFSANEIQLELDKTTFNGSLSVRDYAAPKIRTQWLGSQLALDDYLPPTNETLPSPTTDAPPAPLPLAPLRQLELDARVALQSVTVKGLLLSQPTLVVTSTNGLVQINEASTQVAEGQVLAKGTVDARSNTAVVDMVVHGEAVRVGELLQTFTELDNLTGQATFYSTLQTRGATSEALANNLEVTAHAESSTLQVTPVNIERAFCQAVALLRQEPLPAFEWPKLTKLEPVSTHLTYAAGQLSIDSLSAHIAQLVGSARGTFNTRTGEFNIPLGLSLGNFGTEIQGCLPVPEKWRTRQLPIRCAGSVADLGVKTCLPDTKVITNLLRDKANEALAEEKARALEKLDKEKTRAEARLKEKAQQLLDKNVKDEDKPAVEAKLKELLNELKK